MHINYEDVRPALKRAIKLSLSFALCASLHLSWGSAEPYKVQSISRHGAVGELALAQVTLIAPRRDLNEPDQVVELRSEIHRQLQYLVGNLHGIEGGLALHQARVTDIKEIERVDERFARYQYSAEIEAVITNAVITSTVSESVNESVSESVGDQLKLRVYLPERVDAEGLEAVFARYSRDCVPNTLRSYEPAVYWYDFRPSAFYCPLANWSAPESPEHMVAIETTFQITPEMEAPLYPRYQEFWQDDRLVVTAVYALVGGLLAEQGQEAYQMVFEEMVRTYGEPTSINRPELLNTNHIDIDTPVIHATFETSRGPLELHLFLINSLETPSHVEGDDLSTFVDDYNELSLSSDLLIYNGHAHHGADNARLDELGLFAKGKHQLFFVNTCASYTYGLPLVQQRLLDLNREARDPREYLDMVVNAMPAMGHEIAFMNQRYIKALVEAKESYQSVLSDMYAPQQMLILYGGDESSRAPGKGDLASSGALVTSNPELSSVEPLPSRAQGGCDASRRRHTEGALMFLLALMLLVPVRECVNSIET